MDTTATLQAREDATVYRYRMRKVDVSYSICPSVAAGCPYIHSFRVSDSADSTFKPPPSVRSTKDLFGFAIPDLKALSSDPSTLISSAGVGVPVQIHASTWRTAEPDLPVVSTRAFSNMRCGTLYAAGQHGKSYVAKRADYEQKAADLLHPYKREGRLVNIMLPRETRLGYG